MALVDRSKVASLYTRILLHDLPVHNPTLPPLNADITNTILSFLGLDVSSLNKPHKLTSSLTCANGLLPAMDANHPAEIPPPDGKCPFMTLPTELRRTIFADSLPARDIAIPVRCDDDDPGPRKRSSSNETNHSFAGNRTHSPASSITSSSSSSSSASLPSSSPSPSATTPAKKANRTADLMTLNRRLCAEITEVLYTEREFVVHVHEGFHAGGIEFLNSGRQPLQFYCLPADEDDDDGDGDEGCGGGRGPRGGGMKDPRFGGKFHSGAPFGLDRVKKVRVEILPPPLSSSPSGKEEEVNGRMVAMNTYFMVLALVRLLERAEGPGRDTRITRLRVSFADRCRRCSKRNQDDEDDDNDDSTSTASTSNPAPSAPESSWWWDPHRSQPRETTFHGTSNLQLILLPFSLLRAHQLEILLPPSCATQFASDPATRCFLRRLEGKITGSSSSSFPSATGLVDLLDDGKVWALQQSLAQAVGEEERELQQAIGESLRYDREESPKPARMDDRDRNYLRGASEDRNEIKFGGDEYDLGLSEDMDEFSFEDSEDDEALNEDMGEDDSQDLEPYEGDEIVMRETASEPKEDDTAGLSEDTTATDPDDGEEYEHRHYKATEEDRADTRESRAGREEKKNTQPHLPLTEPLGTTGPMAADIWRVTGTTSINSSTTVPEGARFGQPVAATWGSRIAVVEGQPGENMGPKSVETGWEEEEAVSVLGDVTPGFIAEAAAPASDGVASGNSGSLNIVLENGFGV
ncbi:hypothetical protein NU195Hw_g6014t1 [Hortaea werneckii]